MAFRAGHIVLVAGPSGAGKTTFMERLRMQQLPPDILRRLPRGVEGWPRASAHCHAGGLTSTPAVPAHGGIVVHYDMTYPHCYGVSYADDPGLSFLAEGCSVTVVNIMPSHTQLVGQFQKRLEQRRCRDARKGVLRSFWRRYVRDPAKRLRSALRRPVQEAEDLCTSPEWLDSSLRQWNAFIAGQVADSPRWAVLDIEPWPDASGNPGFRLRDQPLMRLAADPG